MKNWNLIEQSSDRQIQAACKLNLQGKGIVYWKMGEGKTRIALLLFHLITIKQLSPHICLVVCRRKAFDTWRDEILKMGCNWMIRQYPEQHGYSKTKPTIWLLSHAMLRKVYRDLYFYPINCVIYDELYLYSNPKSALSKSATELRLDHLDNNTRYYGLSGTIMSAGDNTSIYSQSRTVGISYLLANNLTDFRSRYQIYFQLNYGHGNTTQYRNKPGSFQQIKERISKFCDFYFPTFSERKVRDVDIQVDPSAQQQKYIQQLKKEYYLKVEEMGVESELRSTLELVHMVSRISNGYFKTDKGIQTITSPKLEALDNKVEEILGVESKCVVWCYYQDDIDYLANHFKYPTIKMSGRHEFDRKLWQGGKISIVLATVGTGTSINDLADVEYALYFSNSYKFLDMEQSRARTDRKNSKHKICYYYNFATKQTFDSAIIKAARQSDQTQQEFIKLCQNSLVSI